MERIYDGKSNGKIIFSEEEMDDIKKSYLNGESSVSIGKRYGVTHKLILRRLKSIGINADKNLSIRTYHLDEKYFDKIDTPNKAYILGFLYADGHNGISKGTISMSLEENDFQILEDIRKELKSDKPLEYLDYSNKHDFGYSYKNQYRLLIFSTHMCKSLEKIGMVSNKSLVLTFPNIEENLFSHFIRGYFDGDGSIYRYTKANGGYQHNLTITSTNSFCQTLSDIIYQHTGAHVGIYDASCHNGITKVATVSGKNMVKKFMDWIYQDAELYLQRKHDRYLDYFYTDNSLSA